MPLRLFALLLLLPLLLPATPAAAQTSGEELWQDVAESSLTASPEISVVRYRALRLDAESLDRVLRQAPAEAATESVRLGAGEGAILALPLPDGGFGRFQLIESPIMEPGLAAKYPQIKTYRGQGIDDPRANLRLDLTPAGLHAMILSPGARVFIDPFDRGSGDLYLSYFARDARRQGPPPSCQVAPLPPGSNEPGSNQPSLPKAELGSGQRLSGDTLRTYRLAVAATGEYTAFHGGTVALGQAAIVTAMNRVNGIYEQEVALRMVLVANNDLVVYTDPATDPYTNGSGSAMLGQNQSNLDAVIGSANYDIGHVFSTGGGGIASLRVPCTNGKARGVTGLGSPTGDPFWVDFVAHEMGHQWGGNHTFNGDEGSCAGGNRNPSTAYEPGSGSTIQAYAGICGSQNLQSNSDPYFHGLSLDEIITYSASGNGDNCPTRTATGNGPPVVDAGAAHLVPLETPFELCGSALDPQGDALTFTWEQFDLGPAGAPDAPSGNAPIFRSFNPSDSPCRTFPRPVDLVAGSATIGEILPTYARTMNFRLTARDNRSGGGGVGDDATTVEVVDTAGPFRLTAPNGGTSVAEGGTVDVTWDVAATDQAPISCTAVDIFLSTDGGFSFPVTLASAAPNDGAQAVTLPASAVQAARIMVRCASSIFFDISDADFGIGVPQLSILGPAAGTIAVAGEVVTFTGSASDPEDGDLSAAIEWSSSIDGALGAGGTLPTGALSTGEHTITASVVDGDANTVSRTVELLVEPACVELLYDADYELGDGGWTDGASTCTTGTFIRGTPDEVQSGGITTQVAGAARGSTFAWFTQNNSGGVGADDVDGGTCETLSPAVAAGGEPLTAFVDYFHGQRDAGDDPEDGFQVELIDASSGAVVATLVSIGDVSRNAVWTRVWGAVENPPASVRLRVRATDGASTGDLVEGGVDNVRICQGQPAVIFQDGFESGAADAWTAAVP